MDNRKYNWLGRLYFWAANRLYNEFAWTYDLVSWLVSFGRWAGWRRAVLGHIQGDRILEIGFGTGELLLGMSREGYNVFGLDRSLKMHRITERKLTRRGICLPRVQGEAQALPFANHSFDTIVSTFPAEFIMQAATLMEVARLLSPLGGGRFVIVGLPAVRKNLDQRSVLERICGIDIQRVHDIFMQIAAGAGLNVQVEYHTTNRQRIPIVILTPI